MSHDYPNRHLSVLEHIVAVCRWHRQVDRFDINNPKTFDMFPVKGLDQKIIQKKYKLA
jgi:hypothetical protein